MNQKATTSRTVKVSAVDQDILTVMNSGRELYGLELLDVLNCDRQNLVGCELSYGSIYPALNRLTKKELITWRWGDEHDESQGARRKYYKITNLGKQRLREIKEYRDNLFKQHSLSSASI